MSSLPLPAQTIRKNTNLEEQIRQIANLRGGVRNVTAVSLKKEIQEAVSLDDEVEAGNIDAENAEEEHETPQSRRETLWKGKQEMLHQLE